MDQLPFHKWRTFRIRGGPRRRNAASISASPSATKRILPWDWNGESVTYIAKAKHITLGVIVTQNHNKHPERTARGTCLWNTPSQPPRWPWAKEEPLLEDHCEVTGFSCLLPCKASPPTYPSVLLKKNKSRFFMIALWVKLALSVPISALLYKSRSWRWAGVWVSL